MQEALAWTLQYFVDYRCSWRVHHNKSVLRLFENENSSEAPLKGRSIAALKAQDSRKLTRVSLIPEEVNFGSQINSSYREHDFHPEGETT